MSLYHSIQNALCGFTEAPHTGSTAIAMTQREVSYETIDYSAKNARMFLSGGPDARDVKVGVIGVGSMGQNHARVLSELGDLGGVADPDTKAGGAVGNRFTVSYFPDYKALLKEKIEAVSICVPTSLHFKVAMDAIAAGKHLLVEKPMCESVRDAERLVKAARGAGVVLAVGHIERHNPVVESARRHLAAGTWGDLITAGARRVSNFPDRIRDVGVIMDLAIHDIDVLRYLIGKPDKSLRALLPQKPKKAAPGRPARTRG